MLKVIAETTHSILFSFLIVFHDFVNLFNESQVLLELLFATEDALLLTAF